MVTNDSYVISKAYMPNVYQNIVAFCSTVKLDENATRANLESFMMDAITKAHAKGVDSVEESCMDDFAAGEEQGIEEGYHDGYQDGFCAGEQETLEGQA